MRTTAAALLLASLGFAQTTPQPTPQEAPQPTFVAADIHASAKVLNPGMRGPTLRGERYDAKDASLLDLITVAYGVQADRVQGGPTWLDADRFDILAKAPAGATSAGARQMLQALLQDRFKLVTHNDTRSLPAYSLIVGKGKTKLKEASGQGSPGCDRKGNNDDAYVQMSCHNETMEMLAQLVQGVEVPAGLLTNPVVDSTHLEGAWDFDFRWTSRAQRVLAGTDQAIPLADALDKQLGLKLESGKTPLAARGKSLGGKKPGQSPFFAARQLV